MGLPDYRLFRSLESIGTPQDFMYLVDYLHQQGIGVILDWVPSHFPSDEHGLAYFDGTHLFEHSDPRQGYHPDWNSYIFNYGRDRGPKLPVQQRPLLARQIPCRRSPRRRRGLDALSRLLAKAGEWIPNEHGGRENLEAISFLQRFNTEVYQEYPDVQTYAEESTAWPMVSRPIYVGGLGFGMKWDMGWMHDTLEYFSKDPIHRRFHHNRADLSPDLRIQREFRPASVPRRSRPRQGLAIGKMPGDDWQKFANLRLLFAMMYAQPGKKLHVHG